jgi:NAD(P)-dependent dehydrogenase (short-subunit alcohol dehydrogenase family)
MADSMADRVVVVTGAGGGIGRATALRFAAEGASVVVNDVRSEAAAETVAAIGSAGGRAHAAPGDVTEPAVNESIVAGTVERFGRLDCFHCNAGGALPRPMLDTDVDEYRRLMALNLDAVWYGTSAALRAMLPQRRGVLLVTTSGAGIAAAAGLAAYGAAKAAVVSLVRSLALEFGPQGIRAVALSPGAMGTEPMLAWVDTLPGGRERYAEHIPARRLGLPEEIANAAVFLASDAASYVNGACLCVDGGVTSILAATSTLEVG